jgi:hypothetical protein
VAVTHRPPATFFDWIDRIGRPLFIRIMLPIALVWLAWEIVRRILFAMDRSIETGQAIPDMTAGWAPIIIAMAPIFANILMDQLTRHRERVRQIDRGQGPGPFASSPPEGPRPGDSP